MADSPDGPHTRPDSEQSGWSGSPPPYSPPVPYAPYGGYQPPQSYPGYPPYPAYGAAEQEGQQPPTVSGPPQYSGVYPPPPEVYQSGYREAYPPPPPPQAYSPGYPGVYPPPPQAYPPGYWQTPWPAPVDPPQAAPGTYAGYPQAQPQIAAGRPKVLLPIASVLVSFGAYALLFGWQFGLGIIVLLFIHEMGHFVVIRAKGLPATLPIFIPLLGAFVTMPRNPMNVRDEAEIGIAGPLAGTVAGLACLVAFLRFGQPVLLPLAYFSFLINLLNLIPVSPLDGARVTSAISKWIWPIGLAGVALGAWYTRDPLLIILGVIGFFQLISRFRIPENQPYYRISIGSRIYVTLLYFGLAALLAYATFMLQPLVYSSGFFF